MTEFEKKVNRKRTLIAKHNVELAELLKTCTHERVEEKSSYYGGSYTNTAYTRYWNQCMICGTCGPETVKEHGWYG
jgi:hypothetical protein